MKTEKDRYTDRQTGRQTDNEDNKKQKIFQLTSFGFLCITATLTATPNSLMPINSTSSYC